MRDFVTAVPGLVWWILLNLAVSVWYGLSKVDELKHARRGVATVLQLACLVFVGAAGAVLVAVFGIGDVLERRADVTGGVGSGDADEPSRDERAVPSGERVE